MLSSSIYSLFHLDTLANILIMLVVFIGGIAIKFSIRYMQGDSDYTKFIVRMILLVLSVSTMVAADHCLLLLSAWAVSNSILIRQMIHHSSWRAARYSGWLAAKTLSVGLVCLASAFFIMYEKTGETSIQAILQQFDAANEYHLAAMILITIAAMTQSAIWPFQRWLVSSVNSPTPVSAIMHAGLVNGGGFLLARFAPMYINYPVMLNALLVFGLLSALIGTTWKLVQPDVKRMLACSTMGQMGFMFVQCGLGLFPAAIAHLCWHGMFKANLFLSASGVVQENRVEDNQDIQIASYLLAVMSGLIGGVSFLVGMHYAWAANDSRLVLATICMITVSQFSLSIMKQLSYRRVFLALSMTLVLTYVYGYSVFRFESLFSDSLYQAQPLNFLHIIAILMLSAGWLLVLFKQKLIHHFDDSTMIDKFYMNAINASQPHRDTVTSHRNQYQYS
jgi:NAD(P)H-quinone oxidoreductase subunit 5